MRVVQFKILKRILEKFETPDYIYAFEKGRSIPNMAQTHVGKKIVLSFDLKDFFTSIKQYHLVQIFQALGFSQPPALTLSELCTYKSFVPQGALTSPKLSNIVTAMTFGPHVKAYCEAKGYDLTIYADDLTISTNQDLDGQEGRDTVKSLCESIKSFVTQYGFRVNGAKTKVMKTYQRQYVCGAVVNQKVNLQKTERHVLRAMVYNCNKNGIEAESKKTGLTPGEFAAKLLGRLNWYAQLNPVAGKEMLLEFYEKSYKDMPSSSPIVTGGGVEASGSSDFPSLPQETISEKDTPW